MIKLPSVVTLAHVRSFLNTDARNVILECSMYQDTNHIDCANVNCGECVFHSHSIFNLDLLKDVLTKEELLKLRLEYNI